eukprot:m.685253 g.685253  ORF g.685253 m.685253 type:complete len:86 (+) comp22836_c0_seq9:394-651(+)
MACLPQNGGDESNAENKLYTRTSADIEEIVGDSARHKRATRAAVADICTRARACLGHELKGAVSEIRAELALVSVTLPKELLKPI